uniref:ERF1 domain-containing protein n=1 Tax=Plectus sambesii TaxID=2011161 RepID=A0A914WH17_9BILA
MGEKVSARMADQTVGDQFLVAFCRTGVELELVESMALLEWLANNYKGFGATLEIVTDKSQEGAQYVRGFGGIGGLLRYQVEVQYFDLENQLDGIDINDY